jgi:hypothetical protein
MPRPIAGEETLPRWLRSRCQRRLLLFGLFLFLLVVTVAWAIAAVFAVLVLWRHGGSHPVAAVFLSGWLLGWATFPVYLVRGILTDRRARRGGTYVFEGWSRVGASLFCGGFAVGWLAGPVAALRQGDVFDFLVGAAFAAVLAAGFIHQFRHVIQRRDPPGR